MRFTIDNNLGYVTELTYNGDNKIITPNTANASEENRIKYINHIRSLIRLKNTGKMDEKLVYSNLLTEMSKRPDLNMDGSPGRLFEFIPVQIRYMEDLRSKTVELRLNGKINSTSGLKIPVDEFRERFLKFSYARPIMPGEYLLQTTLRTCINGGIPYSYIPYNTSEETKAFKAIEVYCPTFVIVRLFEHTQLSKEVEYDKNMSTEEYWYPSNLSELDIEKLNTMPSGDIVNFLKAKGVNRELSSGGIYPWKKRKVILSGWDDRTSWRSLFLDKNAMTNEHSNFTAKEISTVVKAIKETLFPII